MKCAKCGAEIKEGCIYCSVCGNAVQIVPDYSVLEDDYLRSLLKEEESAGKEPAPAPGKAAKAQTAAEEEKSPAAISHWGNSAGASRSGGNSD